MNASLRLITGPTVEPVTLAQARTHLHVDSTAEDTLITALIIAARQMAEDWCYGRKFVTQTWEYLLDWFPCGSIVLPIGATQSITSIKYIDANGVEQTWSSALYQSDLASDCARILPVLGQIYPTTKADTMNTVTVRFVAGYAGDGGSPEDLVVNIPQPIKQAMFLVIGHLFENRRDVLQGVVAQQLPVGAQALLAPYRLPRV